MFKTIKTVAFFFAITFFMSTSCLDKGVEEPSRTAEMEQAELEKIISDLVSEGYDVDTTDLGVYYIVHEAGEGPLAQAGDTCFLEYGGFLLDGFVFDASSFHYVDSTWQFVYKDDDLIPGFDDGIALMNKGAELDLFIPSFLGYGPYPNGDIPAYSTLLFSVKMRDLKPKVE